MAFTFFCTIKIRDLSLGRENVIKKSCGCVVRTLLLLLLLAVMAAMFLLVMLHILCMEQVIIYDVMWLGGWLSK
eukprot:UN04266